MYNNAIFDLDGTIINSYLGVKEGIDYALVSLGKEPLCDEIAFKFFGPAIMDSFVNILKLTTKEAQEATKIYREKYEIDGYKKFKFYDGYPQIFEKLKNANVKLSVASTKPKKFIEKIFKEHNLIKYFDKLEGPSFESDTSSKKDIILKSIVCDNAVMIGDRKFDILGAKEARIDSIAVTYGFGTAKEFKECAPTYIANNTEEIFKIITKN